METTIHPFITFILAQQVPFETIVVFLLFPIIVTFVVILRQIFGLQAFGLYTPSIITVTFLAMAYDHATDIKYPITIYIIVLAVGLLMRFILKRLRILYLPRIAITLTIVSFSVLFLLVLAGMGHRTGFATSSFFPLLIMITLVEKFVSIQLEKGTRTAVTLALETLIIAIIGYLIMSPTTSIGQWVIATIVAYPYVILLIIPINIFIGKWTGLRVAEYFRFRDVLKKIRE